MLIVQRLRDHRWWRLIVVAFLAPIVVLANPSTASAFPGSWQQVAVSFDVLGSQDYVNRTCKFNARNTGGTIEVGTGGYCTGLPDASAGALQPGEAGSTYTITFDGANRAGDECGATHSGVLGPHPLNGTLRVAGSIPSGEAPISGGVLSDIETCSITQVCVRLSGSNFECVTVEAIEAGEAPSGGSCPLGRFVSATYAWENPRPNPWNGSFTDWDLVLTVKIDTGGPSTARWFATLWPNQTASVAHIEVTQNAKIYIRGGSKQGGGMPDMPPRNELHKGVGVYGIPAPFDMQNAFDADAVRPATIEPQTGSDAFGGVTQPHYCRWYVGQKLVDIGGTDVDDPPGDLDVELPPEDVEDPEPEVEQPDPVDEPNDLGWLALIWRALQWIGNMIATLAQKIAAAIAAAISGLVDAVLDGIKALFVPRSGFFRDKAEQVDESMEGTTVSNYVDVLRDLSPGGSTGCSGPSVTLPFGGGTQTPLSSCSGVMNQAASLSRLAIGVGFSVTAFFAVIRILGAGLGWSPTQGGAA